MKVVQFCLLTTILLNTTFAQISDLIEDKITADNYFNRALDLANSSAHDSAIIYYQKAANIYEESAMWKQCATAYKKAGQSYYKSYHYDEAIDNCEKALTKIELSKIREDTLTAEIHNDLGVYYGRLGNFEQRLNHYQKALEIRINLFGKAHKAVANTYYNLGVAYGNMGRHDQRFDMHKRALDIRINIVEENPERNAKDSIKVAESYNALGNYYHEIGDFEKQLSYHQKALRIRVRLLPEDHIKVAESYNNIGWSYGQKKQPDKELEFYEKTLAVFLERPNENTVKISTLYNNLGGCYERMGAYDQQLKYYKMALQLRKEISGQKSEKVANIYKNMARYYHNTGDSINQLLYYRKALDIFQLKLGNTHPKVADLYNKLADYHMERMDWKEAQQMLQSALSVFSYSFDNIYSLNSSGFQNINAKNVLLKTLQLKAFTLAEIFRNESHDRKDLELSLDTYTVAAKLIDAMRLDFFTEASRQGLTQTSLPIYEEGITVGYELYKMTGDEHYLHYAFQFAEKNKSVLLLEALKKSEARKFANIPDTLIEQEKELWSDILFYQKKLDGTNSGNKKQITSYQDKLFTLREGHEKLIKKLENEHADYYDLKYNFNTATISELQKYLSPNSILLEYFQGENSTFVFHITKNSASLHHLKSGLEGGNEVNNFLELFSKEKILEASQVEKQKLFDDYVQYGHALYQSLLHPVLSEPGYTKIDKIVLIPDGTLCYLPFDVLLKQQPEYDGYDFSELDYLINNYQFSYAYSSTMMMAAVTSPLKKYQSNKGLFVGFAPVYDVKDPYFTQLQHTSEEVASIHKVLGQGNNYSGKEATKEKFYAEAKNYNILHLAAHTYINDENPLYSYFMFSRNDPSENGRLDAIDLYKHELNTRMVVLSACETGSGKMLKGEGLMSLARAFAYAGASTLVSSLWEAPDGKTALIIEKFYQHIKQEKAIDEALRLAKLDRLGDIGHRWYSHPYFWAGFVATGDMRSIEMPESKKWLLILGILITMAGVGYLIIRLSPFRRRLLNSH